MAQFQDYAYLMQTQGWAIIPKQLSPDILTALRHDLMVLYANRRDQQMAAGIHETMTGTCHHLLGEHNSMEDLLEHFPLYDFIDQFFQAKNILNSFGAFINQPGDSPYVSNIHRDVRTYARDFKLMLNVLVMLDDFTEENGATQVLSGSHWCVDKPADDLFARYSTRVTGQAGDIVVFDSNIWHAAGQNRSTQVRRGLTLTFTRTFHKQQLDYPKLLGEAYGKQISPRLRQVLGYNARVPTTLAEYYQPREKRYYQADQEA